MSELKLQPNSKLTEKHEFHVGGTPLTEKTWTAVDESIIKGFQVQAAKQWFICACGQEYEKFVEWKDFDGLIPLLNKKLGSSTVRGNI